MIEAAWSHYRPSEPKATIVQCSSKLRQKLRLRFWLAEVHVFEVREKVIYSLTKCISTVVNKVYLFRRRRARVSEHKPRRDRLITLYYQKHLRFRAST